MDGEKEAKLVLPKVFKMTLGPVVITDETGGTSKPFFEQGQMTWHNLPQAGVVAVEQELHTMVGNLIALGGQTAAAKS